MDQLLEMVKSVNGLLGIVLIFALCGTGLFFTFKLKFVQVRKFGTSFKKTFFGGNSGEADENGMTSFQSLATAIAAQVGTGNLAGAATAIAMGGPGAIFWMWLSAFFGMGTIYAEATAAQKYKETDNGKVVGGPAYYIKSGIKGPLGKGLSIVFSICLILALGFFGIMVQSNSIADASRTAFGINPLFMGILVAVLVVIVVLGGIKRIASFTEKVVPIMAGFYIIGALVIIFMNASAIGGAFKSIFVGAFNPASVAGGVVGATIKSAVRYGVQRGLFSNEAGMGSTPHAHAIAKVAHPCDQGLVAMMGVFIDTFIILTLTALVIIMSGSYLDSNLAGIAITQNAFNASFGSFGEIFIAICMFFFAFSTIIGWFFFAETNVRYLTKGSKDDKAVKIFTVAVACFIILGSMLKVNLVWEMADMFNSFMVIPNLIGLLAVSGVVLQLNKEYESKENNLKKQKNKDKK